MEARPNASGEAILVVEDHGGVRRVVRDVLREAGYEVAVVGSLSQGKLLLAKGGFALVISNVVLPDGDGAELVDLAADLGIKTLLITGYEESVRQLEGGPTPLLVKPFHNEELLDAVAKLIGLRTAS
jgi:DNA-binding NtrC family response regulator